MANYFNSPMTQPFQKFTEVPLRYRYILLISRASDYSIPTTLWLPLWKRKSWGKTRPMTAMAAPAAMITMNLSMRLKREPTISCNAT